MAYLCQYMHIRYSFIIKRHFLFHYSSFCMIYEGQERVSVMRFNSELLTMCCRESSFQLMRHKMVEYVTKKRGDSSFLPRSMMQALRDQDTSVRYAGMSWRKTASVPIKSRQRETGSHMQQDNNVLCSGLWMEEYVLVGAPLVLHFISSRLPLSLPV
jgi:hypothetical protein